MASTQSAKSKATAKKAATRKAAANDAIKLLEADHRQVEKWFAEFEKTNGKVTKTKLVEQICTALKVHTQIEEEIFYPASREVLNAEQEEMVDEAVVEHASAKQLIAEIEQMEVGDDLYDAKVKVLSELIEHHVEEEEKEYFPTVRKTDLDLEAIGMQLASRKEELMSMMSRKNGQPIQ